MDLDPTVRDHGVPVSANEVIVRRTLVVLLIILVAFVVALQLYTTLAVRQTQVYNTARAKDTQTLAEQIRSCTTPGGECYDRGQKQTAKAVGTIGVTQQAAAAAGAYCATHKPVPDSKRAMLRCVKAQMRKP